MISSEIKFLAGPPTAASLDWRDEGLLNTFSSALQRYLDSGQPAPPPTPGPTQPVAKWRAIHLGSKPFLQSPPLQKNLPQTNHSVASRLSKAPIDSVVDREEDLDFLDHSLAFHADLQSSQIAPQRDSYHDPGESTFLTDDSIDLSSFDDATTTFLSADLSMGEVTELHQSGPKRLTGPVMNIKAIPNSEYLHRLQPQTMTINLIGGIISIAPARTVHVRKGGYDMEIIEVTIGDETKAGFTISSWHASQDSENKAPDELRKTLQSVRPQDVVLIERVALSSFRGQVFGQSLNRRATKNTTSFTVLNKASQSSVDNSKHTSLSPAIQNKLGRVLDWVSSFVGPSAKRRAHAEYPEPQPRQKNGRQHALTQEWLPPDTQ